MFMGVKADLVATGPESARSVTKGLRGVKRCENHAKDFEGFCCLVIIRA